MNTLRSTDTPFDFRNMPNVGSFERIRIANSQDIVQQKWQTQTELVPPLLFRHSEQWICDWSNGDFEDGSFSIEDGSNAGNENYQLNLIFLSALAPIDFQAWFNKVLKHQQVCVELSDANGNERVFNPFEVSYKFGQKSNHAEMNQYELIFKRSKLMTDDTDRILNVNTDCETGITKFVFANGQPGLYQIVYGIEDEILDEVDGAIGFTGILDGRYNGYAYRKDGLGDVLTTVFVVKCNDCVLEIASIKEVFDCTLSITSISEISGLAENEGILVTGINS